MSLREEQRETFAAILDEHGTELNLPGGVICGLVAVIDDGSTFRESYDDRPRPLNVSCIEEDLPNNGETFDFQGWRYVVDGVSTRPGSPLAKFTAAAQCLT